MKLSDIKKHKHHHDRELNDTVMPGDHAPKVSIYEDESLNKYYQVSEKHSYYRETAGSKNPYEVQSYGEWKKLT